MDNLYVSESYDDLEYFISCKIINYVHMAGYYLITIILATSIYSSTFAQLVNTESSRKERKEGLQGNIGLAYSFSQTTTSITHFQNNLGFQYSKGRNTLLLLNSIEFLSVKTTDERQDLVNQNFQHFRYNYHFRDTSATIWEFFILHQQNKIKYQDLRIVTGTGPRFRLMERDKFRLFLCPLVMYEHEQELQSENSKLASHILRAIYML